FEPDSGCCVGVLELITSSSYVDYAFKVLEVSRALKEQNLKSPNVFEDPSIRFADERRRHELAGISKVLKTFCDILSIPLAQSWALSGYSSVVAISGNLEQSCSSFNKSCIERDTWKNHKELLGDHCHRAVPQESLNIEHEPFVSVSERTSHNVVPYLEKGMTQRKRKRSERVISLEEIDNITGKPNDEAAAIINDNISKLGHKSTHQQELTNLPVGRAQPETTITANAVENLTVKATYKVNTVNFPFILSDEMVKLVELIATRFQLSLGSFKLNYEDEDGDMILIACDTDLMGSVGNSRRSQSNGPQTLGFARYSLES
nr:NIN-like protein [Tanacetum cinerariifolium]